MPDVADVGLLLGLTADGRQGHDPPRHGTWDDAQDRRPPHEPLASERVQFQHTSELRLARLLDFYGVAWVYEPDEYPIEWDAEGRPTAWFRPDFYLPAFDLYIEITTSQQRLVTRKNRKLRLLRAHHPQVRCKLFYQRDYLALVRKYGLDEDLGDGEEE
ncbi:MAG TPA: hypothetical protein VHF25_16560 [Nitriliruptorales bacterium]|nr:hypothetical protein [Nitriliruptorales bacterium]